jgi:hypothetical protein
VTEFTISEPFPLRAGTYWIYKGVVKWTDSTVPSGVGEKVLSWKMEVVRRLTAGPYEVAVMKGHPSDLAWYEGDKKPSEYLIVRDGGKYYRIRDTNISDAASLESKFDSEALFLLLPLPQGCLAPDPEVKRNDIMYCWAAATPRPVRIAGVPGVAPEKQFMSVDIGMRTNPDHEIVTFAAGIGITALIYSHHGTVSEVDVKLAEFHPGP